MASERTSKGQFIPVIEPPSPPDELLAWLPPLDSVENAKLNVSEVQRRILQGYVPQGAAAVRAAEVWLKLEEHNLDRQAVKKLEARIRELEAELARSRRRSVI